MRYSMDIECFQKFNVNIVADSKEEAWDKILDMWKNNLFIVKPEDEDLKGTNGDELPE